MEAVLVVASFLFVTSADFSDRALRGDFDSPAAFAREELFDPLVRFVVMRMFWRARQRCR